MRILATLVLSILFVFSANLAWSADKQDLAKQFSEDVIRKEEEAFFRQQAAKEEAEAKRKAERKKAAAEAKRKNAEESKKKQIVSSPSVKKNAAEPVKKQAEEDMKPLVDNTLPARKPSLPKSSQIKTTEQQAYVPSENKKPSQPFENATVGKKSKSSKETAMEGSEPVKEEKHDAVSETSSSLDDEKAALTRAAELEAAKLEKDKASTMPAADKNVSEVEAVRSANEKNSKVKTAEEADKNIPVKKKDIQGLVFSIAAIVLVAIAGGLWLKNKKSNEEIMNMRNYHRNRNRGRYQR